MNGSGQVLGRAGGRYRVLCAGSLLEATLRGRMKGEGGTHVLVGDYVELDQHPDGAVIRAVLPRRSTLIRRMPGKSGGSRGVAANVDRVVVVGAAEHPAWQAPLIDRFLAVAEASGIPALLVVNKCDLVASVDDLVGPYEKAGYEVLRTSTVTRLGLDGLDARLADRTSLLTGPTGVGKSSMLNTLQPGLSLRTGAVSSRTKTGRHTTVNAEMYPYRTGGFVVDTPGLQDVGLWGLEAADVAGAFPDVAGIAINCRFDDCRHGEEPDCAVIDAVRRGNLSPVRLASYRALFAEAKSARRH